MAEECVQTLGLVPIVVPVISGVAGVFIGAFLAGRQAKIQREYSFIEKQLHDFYSPMLGLRNEIKMKGELRVKIQDIANTTWKELCSEVRERSNQADVPEKLRSLSDERFGEFEGIIEYDNRMLSMELIPAYKSMIKIFRENMWLAEPSTKEYFEKLLVFVDIWDRWLERTMPVEVLEKLEHTEEALNPFYEHLEEMHSSLREKLAAG